MAEKSLFRSLQATTTTTTAHTRVSVVRQLTIYHINILSGSKESNDYILCIYITVTSNSHESSLSLSQAQ